jgi:hypothetical protein
VASASLALQIARAGPSTGKPSGVAASFGLATDQSASSNAVVVQAPTGSETSAGVAALARQSALVPTRPNAPASSANTCRFWGEVLVARRPMMFSAPGTSAAAIAAEGATSPAWPT